MRLSRWVVLFFVAALLLPQVGRADGEPWPTLLHRSHPEALARASRELAQAGGPAARVLAWQRLAQVHDLYGRNVEQATVLAQVMPLPEVAADPALRCSFLLYQARVDAAAGHYVAAAQRLAPLRALLPALTDTTLQLRVRLGLARSHLQLDEYDLATRDLGTLVQLARQAGQPEFEAAALNELGELQEAMRDYGKALAYHREALALVPAWAQQDLAMTRLNIAQMVNIVGDRQEAFTLLEVPLAHFRASGHLWGQAEALLLKGYFNDKAGRLAAAVEAHAEALKLREALQDRVGVINSRTHLAAVLAALGRLREAVEHGRQAVALALRTDSASLQWDAHGGLADALAEVGDFRGAYEHRSRSERALLKSSRLDLISRTSALREQFDTDRQVLENTRLVQKLAFEQQEQSRLSMSMAVLTGLLALLVLASLALMRLYWHTRRLAKVDGLTQLLNRRSVLEHCEMEFERAGRYHLPMSVLMFDLDEFKQINDGLGHAAGDRVLRRVAEVCRSTLRKGDHAGRIGGEEFLLVLPHTDVDAALVIAERLRCRIADEVKAGDDVRVTASFGVAGLKGGAMDAHALIQQADEALYRAKHGGRNRSELASAASDAGERRPAGVMPMPLRV